MHTHTHASCVHICLFQHGLDCLSNAISSQLCVCSAFDHGLQRANCFRRYLLLWSMKYPYNFPRTKYHIVCAAASPTIYCVNAQPFAYLLAKETEHNGRLLANCPNKRIIIARFARLSIMLTGCAGWLSTRTHRSDIRQINCARMSIYDFRSDILPNEIMTGAYLTIDTKKNNLMTHITKYFVRMCARTHKPFLR